MTYYRPPKSTPRKSTPREPANGTTVVNAIDPHDVARMVLVADPHQPFWQLTVIGSFNGPAHAALLRDGEVPGASSLRVTDGELTGPILDATIVRPGRRNHP